MYKKVFQSRYTVLLRASLYYFTQIERDLWVLDGEMNRDEIQEALELKHRDNLRDTYLNSAIEEGWVEMTIPDKPTRSKQTYHLTKKGLKKKH
ncbi:Fic family protein [Flavobacterium sp. K5-23]|uniref:Fic family protein n=1 Tax=Flavobacterium sp. K5-23 TaxID=2746225 RepID=UPI00200D9098|nr:hypothetical protein [Flavobacterium sp. K5-23]UQD56686.1 hypothetical protein FLAK523_09925 [Flavobacterium sp. K5-23]